MASNIETKINRIAAAKEAISAAIAGKGVTVPDGTLIDGMAELIASIEAGGGGGINATAGTITVSSDVNNYVLTHGLGEVPKFFVIGMIDKFSSLSGKTYILIGAFGFSDANTQYRISANSNVNAASGTYREYAINSTSTTKCSLKDANEETIVVADISGTQKLIAGTTYYWVAVGSGVF